MQKIPRQPARQNGQKECIIKTVTSKKFIQNLKEKYGNSLCYNPPGYAG